MPLQSREVITLRLVLDCDCDVDLNLNEPSSPTLATLPVELRLIILRYLLRFDRTCNAVTRRVPSDAVEHLLNIDSHRILEAPHFKHRRSKQDLNGLLPVSYTCKLHPAILRVSKKLLGEGQRVLYEENKVIGIQCGIKGLASRLRRYGLPAWGPISSTFLDFEIVGKRGAIIRHSKTEKTMHGRFSPVLHLRGQNATSSTPLYICRAQDGPDVLHALWILVMCPFARGMKFNAYLPRCRRPVLERITDSLIQLCALPWLHNHLDRMIIEDGGPTHLDPRRRNFDTTLQMHKQSSDREPCVYTYHAICAYLEILMSTADKGVEAKQYLKAETLYERVLYEASGVMRTRTGKLVYVSDKSKDGINRICKLIAVSAFRLCELRSGFIVKHQGSDKASVSAKSRSGSESQQSPVLAFVDADKMSCGEQQINRHPLAAYTSQDFQRRSVKEGSIPLLSACSESITQQPSTHVNKNPRTTRLESSEASSHALLAGLLALRLPCATTVPEWNIRINLMLMFIFNLLRDAKNCYQCLKKLQCSCDKLLQEVKERNRKGRKWGDLESLVDNLKMSLEHRNSDTGRALSKKRRIWEENEQLIEGAQHVVRQIWGQRMVVKRQYVGLIWTFRWA